MVDHQRIEDLRRRVQHDPASIAFAQLAEELRRARHLDEAIDACRAGLAIHPTYLSARVTLGRALAEKNELEQAEQEFELVLHSAPENLAARRGLGDVHHRRGEVDQALVQFRTALSLAPNDFELEQTVAELARDAERIRSAVAVEEPAAVAVEAPATVAPSAAVAEAVPAEEPEELAVDFSALEELAVVGDLPHAIGSDTGDELDAAVAPDAAALEPPEPLAGEPAMAAEEPESSGDDHAVAVSFELQPDDPTRDRAMRTVTALQEWLDAIHVARTQQRA